MDGTPNAATFGSPDPNTGAYGNNTNPDAPAKYDVSPMVTQLQNFGRNNDTQLVHMTPGEVGGLQALAQAHGGSLTTNPVTGLPEAGFLEDILPTLLGVGLSFIPGVGPLMAAGITGLGTTAVTGDLNKGLMAGLGAFGGASLAGGLGLGAATATLPGATVATALPGAGTAGLPSAVAAPASLAGVSYIAPTTMANASALSQLASTGAGAAGTAASAIAPTALTNGANAAEIALRTGATNVAGAGNPMLAQVLGPDLGAKATTFGNRFANTAGENLMSTATKPSVMRTGLAALGAGMPLMQALQPEYKPYEAPKSSWKYEGPYKPQDRKAQFPTSTPTDGEATYFQDSNPYPGYLTSTGAMPAGFADGGSTAVQAAPTTAVFAPSQAQTYGAPSEVNSAQLAQMMMPSGAAFAQSMEHAPTAGPLQFEPFKTEKQIAPANKVKAPATVPDNTPTQGGMNFGGFDFSGLDLSGLDLGGLGSYSPSAAIAPTAPVDYSGMDFGNMAYGDRGPQGAGTYTPAPAYTPSDFGNTDFSWMDSYSPAPATLEAAPAPAYTPSDFGSTDFSWMDSYSPAPAPATLEAAPTFAYDPADYSKWDYRNLDFGNMDFSGFASGGQVPLEDGAFIVDARTVSELGNGSSRAGQDLLAKYGGKTLHGPGDGVSDSIKANIGGKQAARVARDEVKFSPREVAKIGGGDLHKGTNKLYAMMDRAQKARQSAQRGQNTGLQGILKK